VYALTKGHLFISIFPAIHPYPGHAARGFDPVETRFHRKAPKDGDPTTKDLSGC
jgi:hypothetical protein